MSDGYNEEELKARVEHLAFAGFLNRPIRSKALLAKVREVVTHQNGSKE